MARYPHDCEKCVSVGSWREYDLYYCPIEPTVVARFGADAEYVSGLPLAGLVEPLGVAYRRSAEAGHIREESP